MLEADSGRALLGTHGVELNELWPNLLGHGMIAFSSIEHGVAMAFEKVNPEKASNSFLGKPLSKRIDLVLDEIEVTACPDLAALAAALIGIKPLLQLRNHIAHNPVMLDVFVSGDNILTTQSVVSLKSGGMVMSYSVANDFVRDAKIASRALYAALAALP